MGNPGPLLGTISVLVHQVLPPAPVLVDGQDAPNRERRTTVNHLGGRRAIGWQLKPGCYVHISSTGETYSTKQETEMDQNVSSRNALKALICFLHLAIGLCVVWVRKGSLPPRWGAEWSPHLGGKFGILCRQKICCTRSAPVSTVNRSLVRGTKWTALEKWFTTVRMMVCPLNEGRPVMKSMVMCGHQRWGVGRGLSRPVGGWCDIFRSTHRTGGDE